MPSKRGFTLIELLVVVAIIVALLAILLPSFARALEAVERTACGSNLKQNHIAFISYAADYRGQFPYTLSTQPHPYYWDKNVTRKRIVGDYMSNVYETLYCPAWLANNTYSASHGGAPPVPVDPATPRDPSRSAYWWGVDWGAAVQVVGYVTMTHASLSNTSGYWTYEGRDLYVPSVNAVTAHNNTLMACMNMQDLNSWNVNWTRAHVNPMSADIDPAGRNAAHVDGSVRWADYRDMKMMFSHNFGRRDWWW